MSGYLAGDGSPEELLATMGRIMLPEDADSHSLQIVGAALEQFRIAKGHRVWAAREDRSVSLPVGPFTHPPDAGPDLLDSPSPPAWRRHLPVMFAHN